MPSILPGYEYDIFISYRQNDNQEGWVTRFVESLQQELKSLFKEEINLYFDSDPNHGLHETHDVDGSLKEKVKCLVFIPIVSQTYCDPNAFAWQKEFLPFLEFAKQDEFGLDVKVSGGNVSKRVLPVRIHDLDAEDQKLFEEQIGGVMRPVDFIYKEAGVIRPLRREDSDQKNLNQTNHRNQVNKVARAIKDIITSLRNVQDHTIRPEHITPQEGKKPSKKRLVWMGLSVTVVVLVLGYFLLNLKSNSKSEASKHISIAIVPFHNQTNDPVLNNLGFGMATEIRTQLSLSDQFDFISSDQATLKYSDSNLSPKEIGEQLKVDYLLSGNFYKLGNQLKLNTELSETANNKSLWSFPIDFNSTENMTELFSIQDEISKRVMDWFSFKKLARVEAPTNNSIAYQYYLEGVRSSNKELPIALQQFKRSIALDSNFQAAQLELFLEEDRRLWNNGNDTLIRENDLRPLINRIESIDPNSWETMLAKGVFFYHQMKDYEKGLRFFEESIKINPNGYGVDFASAINRRRLNLDKAFQQRLKTIRENPERATVWNELALIFDNNGNSKDALKAELIANRLGLVEGFSSGMSYAMAVRDSSLYGLPESIQNYFGNFYYTELAIEQRDWNKLLAIADTSATNDDEYTEFDRQIDKAIAYYMIKNPEKARQSAMLAVKEVDNKPFFGRIYFLYVLMGENENALNNYQLQLSGRFVIDSHNQQDMAEFCDRLIRWIQLQAFAGEYEGATQSLLQLNNKYPKYGGYQKLRNEVWTYKIRREYPPFNEALRNLKLPPRLEMPDEFDDM